mgnify:CR=1 FL=1
MTSGPTTLTVGDNPGGVEAVSVVPISGTGTTSVSGSSLHMAGGGTALVGGAEGQLFSNQIQFHMSKSNWSQASALAAMLLVGVLLLYWLYDRLVGIDKLKLG